MSYYQITSRAARMREFMGAEKREIVFFSRMRGKK
jgi:hypothetical protein